MTAPYPPSAHQELAPSQPKNGLGTAGFVTGLIGLVFSPIPVIGLVAWPLVIVGLVLSILGVSRAAKGRATNKGLSITGVVLSAVGLVVCVVWVLVINKAVDDVQNADNAESTLVYEVGGNAKGATVNYSTLDQGNTSSNEEQPAALPWKKELKIKGIVKGGTVSVTAGEAGGTVTCKVTIDGQVKKTATATGPFATASCEGF
ncbi:DUF4190 domain-containing protein [Solihabitans fulvus]|uniref:DUF4190 domain-containing protein n=1 Tax=Solihabitans fulvus TaxID=1892852 RepID=A0A5B2XLM7_9PSEU|nr:MmpS family transport accessory protein [Solihabitans fulvus]KAA2264768.1 DUF4190 domain-containing protein [Solihabitans fulvus]